MKFLAAALACLILLTGCGHKQAARTHVPPPPTVASPEPSKPAPTETPIESTKPAYVEIGLASWYGPPYHNRKGANGQIFNQDELTAAHRTLPLNSLVRVTNLKTGAWATVRITDRGPFIEGRILDLSREAAKILDVWRAGVAKVKIEVLETPAPIDTGGHWAVQIGAFENVTEATRLKHNLARRYQDAKILEFAGPTGEWLRVRVPGDDKRRAQQIAAASSTPQGAVFLVRLD